MGVVVGNTPTTITDRSRFYRVALSLGEPVLGVFDGVGRRHVGDDDVVVGVLVGEVADLLLFKAGVFADDQLQCPQDHPLKVLFSSLWAGRTVWLSCF